MSSTPSGSARAARLREAVEPVVTAAGLDLEELRSEAAGKRRLVRVIVDGDGGVTLDDVAELSKKISARLDEIDAAGGAAYVLEVTSPGVDRPLTAPRHWRRARGRLVRIRGAADGEKRSDELVGRVTGADEESVTLDVDGAPVTVRFADVASARVQVEFGRPAGAPGAGSEDGAGEADEDLDDVDADDDDDDDDADDEDDDGLNEDDTADDADRRAGRQDED